MFGAVIKTFFGQKEGIEPENICSVSVMPCTAKKFECNRSEMRDSGFKDVDITITVEELAKMFRTAGIDFDDLDDQDFDAPFGLGSGAGQIFGTSPYHFIEIMACQGGCVGDGGNSPKTIKILEKRRKALYDEDKKLPIRRSHENPYIKQLYEEYLGEPLGERSHQLLHTIYHSRRDLLR